MGVMRRFIFPSLRILVWGVIAAALVKMAFAGPTVAVEDPLTPSAQVVEPQVEVTTATVTNTVTVQASVLSDPAVPVRATLAGTVSALPAQEGQHVDAGTPLLEIKLETPVEPTTTTNPETGEQTVVEHPPKVTRQTVTAPVAGTLHLAVLKDQIVSVGDQVGTVAPGTLSVTGSLTPDQRYRLITMPTEAQVTLRGGPAPFTCTGLRIGADAETPTEGEPSGGTGAPASGTVSCAVPADVTAFAGLAADLVITNGAAEDALVVPVTAVQGSVQTGNVWVVLPDGSNEQRQVALGLTDGEVVQVTDGLALGDAVLEFIPVADTDAPTGQCDPVRGC